MPKKHRISKFLTGGSGAAPPQSKKKKKISEFLTEGRTQQRQQSSAAPPSALPPKKPAEAPKTWAPLIDPRRSGKGTTSKAAEKDVPDWITKTLQKGFADDFGLEKGENLQWGDIAPNIQDIFKPMARPGITKEEREGERGPEKTFAELQAQHKKAVQYHRSNPRNWAQGLPGVPVEADPNMPEAPSGLELLGAWLQSGENPFGEAVGGAVRGIPQTVMNLLNTPSIMAKQTIGTAEQALGVDVNPAQMILGGQTSATLNTLVAPIARAVGADDIAEHMEAHQEAPPGVVANLLANVVARQRENGQDTTVTEGLLNAALDAQSMITERPDTEAVIAQQGELIKSAREISDNQMGEAWDAAMFAYAGTPYMDEARKRLEAGEDWNSVYDDIDARMTGQERAQDFVGEMVIDPMNVLDSVGGVTGLLGMQTRSERAAAHATRELFLKTDEGVGLARAANFGGDVRHVGAIDDLARRVPVVGELFKPLPETLAAARGEEASSVIKAITQGISPQAPARLMNAQIDIHPVALAAEAFLNPNADDLVEAGGKVYSSSQIQEMLGLGGRVISPNEAKVLGVGNNEFLDMFQSNAAERARDWMQKMTQGDGAQKLFDDFAEMQGTYSDIMRAGEVVVDGKVISGDDAIKIAEDKLVTWLEQVNEAYKVAAEVPEASGFYKKVLDAKARFTKIQGPFRFFHLGTNPGNMVRNVTSNFSTGWIDDWNMLSPLRNTQDEIGRLGFGEAGLGRQLGGQSDVMKTIRTKTEGGLKGLWAKVDPMERSATYEAKARQRIHLQAAKREMSESWRVGKSIPEKDWYQIEHIFGDRAEEAKRMLENSWEAGGVDKWLQRITGDDSWKGVAHSALKNTHDDVLRTDLDELISGAANRDEARRLIDDYVSGGRDQFRAFMARGTVMDGSPASFALDAAEQAYKGLNPKRRSEWLNDFTKELVRQDATVHLQQSYTKQALEQLNGISKEDLLKAGFQPGEYLNEAGQVVNFNGDFSRWMQARMTDAERLGTETMQNFRPTQYEALDAIQEGDLERLRKLGDDWAKANPPPQSVDIDDVDFFATPNPFGHATNKQEAWDAYRNWTDDFFHEYRKTRVQTYKDIQQEAADAVEAVTRKRPPSAPTNLVERFLPLTQPEQRRLFAQLDLIARSRGINTRTALRDVLQEQGVIHANTIFRADIANQEWYYDAVAAIGRWSGESMVDDASKWADDADEIAIMMQKLSDPFDASSMDQVQGAAAQMAERDAQIQTVLDALEADAGKISNYSDADMARLRAFADQMHTRHVMQRSVAERVGTAAGDFSLVNYGDQRGIDLLSGFMYNYPKWYMATLKNSISRTLESPGKVAALMKLRQNLRDVNRDLPEWYQDQISLKTPMGPMYFNALGMIDPFNGFIGDKFRDPDIYNGDPLSQLMAEAQQYGPGLHGTWVTLMASRALINGDREESMGWLSNMGPMTRGVTAITALAKEYVPGMDFLPSGGVVVEPWLWGSGEGGEGGVQMIGTKWDARRVGMSIAQMVDSGEITAEEGYDAMLAQHGEVYDRALQMSKVKTAGQTIASWLFGAGIKPRPGIEAEVQQMDIDRVALMQAKDEGYYDGHPELWRQAWEEMREKYPWMDFVQASRRDDIGRSNIYAMSVYDRLPPNPRPYIEALMGGEADMYSDMLDKFYGGEPGQVPCSIENLSPNEQDIFMSMMKLMGATMALPGDATESEWNMARQSRRAMYDRLKRQYEGIDDIQTRYFDILNSGDENAAAKARQYLNENGRLQAYWDDKDAAIAGDPILSKYWGSMEMFERVSRDQWEAQMETTYPGLHDAIDEYYRLKDQDPDLAKEFLSENPNIKAYWREKDVWVMGLDEELMEMSSGIGTLEGDWGTIREGVEPEMLGQQRVIDLIESGSRPMGDFVLPEDMDARQVQAAISHELEIHQGSYGAMLRQLKSMGGLDRTLIAFQEFARGSGNLETVMSNLSEAKALLVALSSINEGTADYAGGGGYGGGGSSRRSRRVSSRNYSNSKPAPRNAAQQQQDNQKVDAFMAKLQAQAPAHWGMLRNLSDMSMSEIAAYLQANPDFMNFVKQTGFSLDQLTAYWKRINAARASTSRKGRRKSNKVTITTYSQKGL